MTAKFDLRPRIIFHYFLLAAAIFGLHELSMYLGLETPDKLVWLYLFYVLGLFLADEIIHVYIIKES